MKGKRSGENRQVGTYANPSAKTDNPSSTRNTQLRASEKTVSALLVGATHGSSSTPSWHVMRAMNMSLRMPATSRTTRTRMSQCLVREFTKRDVAVRARR